MKIATGIARTCFLALLMAALSNIGKGRPGLAFFHCDGSLTVRLALAVVLLGGIPASVCALTRQARSAWTAILVLAAAMLVAPWVDMCLDWYMAGDIFLPSIDSLVWEPMALGAILVVPVLLMRHFVPAFRCREDMR
jgi:hypothetical protein